MMDGDFDIPQNQLALGEEFDDMLGGDPFTDMDDSLPSLDSITSIASEDREPKRPRVTHPYYEEALGSLYRKAMCVFNAEKDNMCLDSTIDFLETFGNELSNKDRSQGDRFYYILFTVCALQNVKRSDNEVYKDILARFNGVWFDFGGIADIGQWQALVDRAFERLYFVVLTLRSTIEEEQYDNILQPLFDAVQVRCNIMLQMLHVSLLLDTSMEDQKNDQHWKNKFSSCSNAYTISSMDSDEKNRMCFLIRDFFSHRQYRKKGDIVYEKVFSLHDDQVFDTHAFKRIGNIQEVILANIGLAENSELHRLVVKLHGSFRGLCEVISGMKNDVSFPEYSPCQTQLAFTDCVVDMEANKVYKYPNVPGHIVASNYIPLAYLPTHEVARNLDMTMDMEDFIESWKDIKTDALDTILLTQLGNEREKCIIYFWICALLGRMYFQVGQRDRWDLFIFFFGLSQTGKSLVMNQIRNAVGAQNVAVLKNSMQETFGIANLMDGTVVLGYEIDSRLNFAQTDLQSMVSGEPLSASVKFQQEDRACEAWKSHIAMCGNEVPAKWLDSANQLSRRCACIHNQVVVQQHNPNLGEDLKNEVPAFVAKTYLAYLYLTSRQENKKNFFDIAPEYFRKTKTNMAKNLNSLVQFLCSRYIERSPSENVSISDFETYYNKYIATYDCDNKIKCGTSSFEQILEKDGIHRTKRGGVWYYTGISFTPEVQSFLGTAATFVRHPF